MVLLVRNFVFVFVCLIYLSGDELLNAQEPFLYDNFVTELEQNEIYAYQGSQDSWLAIKFLGFRKCIPVIPLKLPLKSEKPVSRFVFEGQLAHSRAVPESEIWVLAVVHPGTFKNREAALQFIKKTETKDFQGETRMLSTFMYRNRTNKKSAKQEKRGTKR